MQSNAKLCWATAKRTQRTTSFPGGHGEEEIPVPIPNTAVKLLSGGSSWRAISRKISALPGINLSIQPLERGAVLRLGLRGERYWISGLILELTDLRFHLIP